MRGLSSVGMIFAISSLMVLGSGSADAGDVYRTIAAATDPVVAPQAPDPETLLPPLVRATRTTHKSPALRAAGSRSTSWSDSLRFPALPLQKLPSLTAFGR